MLTRLPVEADKPLYVIPLPQPKRHRVIVVGRHRIALADEVSDTLWRNCCSRLHYVKYDQRKSLYRAIRTRRPVLMFRQLSDILPDNCTADRLRYYDTLAYPDAHFRDDDELVAGVNRIELVKVKQWWNPRALSVPYQHTECRAALLALTPVEVPDGALLTYADFDAIKAPETDEPARYLDSLVVGPV